MSVVATEEPSLLAMPVARRQVRNYLPTLDGWRALAILMVLLCHGADGMQRCLGSWSGPLAGFWKVRGLVGVRIFFGISGFLITSRLLDEMRDSRDSILKRFYIRRAFRIFPPALAFLSIVGALGLLGLMNIRYTSWWSALLFVSNYWDDKGWYTGHFWSLAVEEHFYLLWPTLLLFAGRRKGMFFATGIAVTVAVWRVVCYHYQLGMGEKFYGRTDVQLDGLLWGAVAACLFTHAKFRNWFSAPDRWMLAPVLIVLLAVSFSVEIHGWKSKQLLYTLQAMAIPVVLLSTILQPRSVISAMLEFAPLAWLGRLSYSLYLWQQVFCVWTIPEIPEIHRLQTWPLNLVAALACAITSYYFLERPFMRIGNRVAHAKLGSISSAEMPDLVFRSILYKFSHKSALARSNLRINTSVINKSRNCAASDLSPSLEKSVEA